MTQSLITSVGVELWPPAVELRPHGLMAVMSATGGWFPPPDPALAESQNLTRDDPARWLTGGMHVRTFNYGFLDSTGIWTDPWCLYPPTQVKGGTRPVLPNNFEPVTAWAFDYCDLTDYSHDEVNRNVRQWLKLQAPLTVETSLATRMLTDVGTLPAATSVLEAIGAVEGALGATNTVGYIHASPALAAAASTAGSICPDPDDGLLKTRLGNIWVFGGGYFTGLGNTLVATSQPYGWMNDPQVRTTIEQEYNQYVAVAEQSFVIGYESLVGAAVVSTPMTF